MWSTFFTFMFQAKCSNRSIKKFASSCLRLAVLDDFAICITSLHLFEKELYVVFLVIWDFSQVHSCCVFPGVPFPKNYISNVKKIMTRLFRVFVHIYIHHFDKLVGIGAVSRVFVSPTISRLALYVGFWLRWMWYVEQPLRTCVGLYSTLPNFTSLWRPSTLSLIGLGVPLSSSLLKRRYISLQNEWMNNNLIVI